jgi:hypothetical protein
MKNCITNQQARRKKQHNQACVLPDRLAGHGFSPGWGSGQGIVAMAAEQLSQRTETALCCPAEYEIFSANAMLQRIFFWSTRQGKDQASAVRAWLRSGKRLVMAG